MNLQPLIALGQQLSGLAWVQGPGGNLSVKNAQMLVVKASGTRLGDLHAPNALALVPMALAQTALAGDERAEKALFNITPRPSLETWLHALPGRYVVHTHPLGVLLWACSARKALPDVADIGAALPGRDLALALLAHSAADAWLLRNHGLVVRASSARQALQMTRQIDAVCRRAFGVRAGDLPVLPPVVAQPVPGGFIADISPQHASEARYLFPDAAVLAAQTSVAELTLEAAGAKLVADARPGVLVTPLGSRWAVARTETQLRDVVEVVTAHDWLLARLGNGAVPLPDSMTAAILAMPAERFRQGVAP